MSWLKGDPVQMHHKQEMDTHPWFAVVNMYDHNMTNRLLRLKGNWSNSFFTLFNGFWKL